MIPKEIIEKAIEGGWKRGVDASKNVFSFDIYESGIVYSVDPVMYIDAEEMIIDPLFWQSLGKALGWDKEDEENLKLYHASGGYGRMPVTIYKWNKNAHNFYNLLLTSGNTEKFWKDLLD
jgi:hypothetical protein